MPDAAHASAEPLDILIVDDEAETRELLGEFCRAQGARVVFASDGRAAITAIERARPPLPVVLADLHLPHADGFAVLAAARRAHPSCYVILITGYATIDSAVRAVRAGAYDFLAKPFALGQLEVLLDRIRDRMTLEAANRLLTRQVSTDPPSPIPADALSAHALLMGRLRDLEARVAVLEQEARNAHHRNAGQGCQGIVNQDGVLHRITR